jgi:hypothetical protein
MVNPLTCRLAAAHTWLRHPLQQHLMLPSTYTTMPQTLKNGELLDHIFQYLQVGQMVCVGVMQPIRLAGHVTQVHK